MIISRTARSALTAEAVGTFLLFATVVGSGIMAERLAGGNDAIALLGNTVATSAILFVLITMLGPISGAHFNPLVSLIMALRKSLSMRNLFLYALIQLSFGIMAVWAAHVMFELPILQISAKSRMGVGQWLGEAIASFGLITTIIATEKHRPQWVPASVALYICAAYWFTSSTSFANPAITIARSMTNSFSGIAPHDVPMFILAQVLGGLCGLAVSKQLAT